MARIERITPQQQKAGKRFAQKLTKSTPTQRKVIVKKTLQRENTYKPPAQEKATPLLRKNPAPPVQRKTPPLPKLPKAAPPPAAVRYPDAASRASAIRRINLTSKLNTELRRQHRIEQKVTKIPTPTTHAEAVKVNNHLASFRKRIRQGQHRYDNFAAKVAHAEGLGEQAANFKAVAKGFKAAEPQHSIKVAKPVAKVAETKVKAPGTAGKVQHALGIDTVGGLAVTGALAAVGAPEAKAALQGLKVTAEQGGKRAVARALVPKTVAHPVEAAKGVGQALVKPRGKLAAAVERDTAVRAAERKAASEAAPKSIAPGEKLKPNLHKPAEESVVIPKGHEVKRAISRQKGQRVHHKLAINGESGPGLYTTDEAGAAAQHLKAAKARVENTSSHVAEQISYKTTRDLHFLDRGTAKGEAIFRDLQRHPKTGKLLSGRSLINRIKAAGYDGVVYPGVGGRSREIVFHSASQVRRVGTAAAQRAEAKAAAAEAGKAQGKIAARLAEESGRASAKTLKRVALTGGAISTPQGRNISVGTTKATVEHPGEVGKATGAGLIASLGLPYAVVRSTLEHGPEGGKAAINELLVKGTIDLAKTYATGSQKDIENATRHYYGLLPVATAILGVHGARKIRNDALARAGKEVPKPVIEKVFHEHPISEPKFTKLKRESKTYTQINPLAIPRRRRAKVQHAERVAQGHRAAQINANEAVGKVLTEEGPIKHLAPHQRESVVALTAYEIPRDRHAAIKDITENLIPVAKKQAEEGGARGRLGRDTQLQHLYNLRELATHPEVWDHLNAARDQFIASGAHVPTSVKGTRAEAARHLTSALGRGEKLPAQTVAEEVAAGRKRGRKLIQAAKRPAQQVRSEIRGARKRLAAARATRAKLDTQIAELDRGRHRTYKAGQREPVAVKVSDTKVRNAEQVYSARVAEEELLRKQALAIQAKKTKTGPLAAHTVADPVAMRKASRAYQKAKDARVSAEVELTKAYRTQIEQERIAGLNAKEPKSSRRLRTIRTATDIKRRVQLQERRARVHTDVLALERDLSQGRGQVLYHATESNIRPGEPLRPGEGVMGRGVYLSNENRPQPGYGSKIVEAYLAKDAKIYEAPKGMSGAEIEAAARKGNYDAARTTLAGGREVTVVFNPEKLSYRGTYQKGLEAAVERGRGLRAKGSDIAATARTGLTREQRRAARQAGNLSEASNAAKQARLERHTQAFIDRMTNAAAERGAPRSIHITHQDITGVGKAIGNQLPSQGRGRLALSTTDFKNEGAIQRRGNLNLSFDAAIDARLSQINAHHANAAIIDSLKSNLETVGQGKNKTAVVSEATYLEMVHDGRLTGDTWPVPLERISELGKYDPEIRSTFEQLLNTDLEQTGKKVVLVKGAVGEEMFRSARELGPLTKLARFGTHQSSLFLLGLNPTWAAFQVFAEGIPLALGHGGLRGLKKIRGEYDKLPVRTQHALDITAGAVNPSVAGDVVTGLRHTDVENFSLTAHEFEKAGAAPWKRDPRLHLIRLDRMRGNAFRRAAYLREINHQLQSYYTKQKNVLNLSTKALDDMRNLPFDQQVQYFLDRPELANRIAKEVDGMLGEWTALTNRERWLSSYVMFYPFLRYSIRFVFKSFPEQHPIKAAIAAHMGAVNEKALKDLMGENDFQYMNQAASAIVYNSDGTPDDIKSVARFTPVGNALLTFASDPRFDITAASATSPALTAVLGAVTGTDPLTGKRYEPKNSVNVGGLTLRAASDKPALSNKDRAQIGLALLLHTPYPLRSTLKPAAGFGNAKPQFEGSNNKLFDTETQRRIKSFLGGPGVIGTNAQVFKDRNRYFELRKITAILKGNSLPFQQDYLRKQYGNATVDRALKAQVELDKIEQKYKLGKYDPHFKRQSKGLSGGLGTGLSGGLTGGLGG